MRERPFVIAKLMGRCGNQFYQIATAMAYAKKHNIDFYCSSDAQNADNNAYYFKNFPKRDISSTLFEERLDERGHRVYQELPRMENVMLIGYWQCFDYFNEYRQEILDAFAIPYELNAGVVSIHVRRGDIGDLGKPLGWAYYSNAIKYMIAKGFHRFIIFSDDIPTCKAIFGGVQTSNLKGIPTGGLLPVYEFSEGKTELEDLSAMSGCEHNICANSSFSYVSAWLNRNPDKMVLTPDYDNMFDGHNTNMIPDNWVRINAVDTLDFEEKPHNVNFPANAIVIPCGAGSVIFNKPSVTIDDLIEVHENFRKIINQQK